MTRTDAPAPHHDDAIDAQLARLDLDDKIRLLTGSGPWTLHALPDIGLRSVVVSDGPAGVRGVTDSTDETGASFPSPTALAATWDIDLADRLGLLFAAEARRHGVDVVLAPVINLQRTPVGGRHFECFSEDPLLTARIAGAVVSSIQAHGVAACAKHFVANDSETARTDYIAHIDERALREVYLAPFEALVKDHGVWTIMAAYNGLDMHGEVASATDHHGLLTGLLKREWGFDGVVMSDWTAANTTATSANAGLDLVMPGPGGPWEQALHKAVARGEVAEAVIDDKVRRLLRLAHRVGAIEPLPEPEVPPLNTSAFLRELGARSTVVIKDDARLLPQQADRIRRLALIGPNAVDTFFQGGGSAHVNPDHVVTPLDGLVTALPSDAQVTVHRGGYARPHEPDLDPGSLSDGTAWVDFFNGDGDLVDTCPLPEHGWIRGIDASVVSARLRATVRLHRTGTHWLGLGTVGRFSIAFDGTTVAAGDHFAGHDVVLDSSVNTPPSHGGEVAITSPREVELTADLQVIEAWGHGRFVRAVLRHRRPGPSTADEIAAAAAAAAEADVAVVIVGTNSEVESEGFDRTGLDLPGQQDELVRRVCAANPNTVVVVNAGAPVVLPWLDRAGTVIWTWFPGQECGNILADVLFGATEPSGRLPWTLPAAHDDVPVPHAVPDDDGIVEYHEGIHVGYRGYLRDDITPAAPFGHGLGWTDWDYDSVQVSGSTDGATITVQVTNCGPRHGRETVQAYLEFVGDGPERPVRWLAGFAVVDVDAAGSVSAEFDLPPRVFRVWDPAVSDWVTPEGRYVVHIGRSLSDTRLSVHIPMP